jgi:S-adenosylmethionine hydrolase
MLTAMDDANPNAPLITLMTDFGQSDTYVAIMKGVILTHCRGARLVDLTHDIDAGDVASGADALASAWRYFPDRTIHCAVVDPGVGTDRRPLVIVADGQYFVGPDNGLFSGILATANKSEIWHVTKREFFLSPMSRTFHGRDVFAPIAAALGRGIPTEDMGDRLDDLIRLPEPQWHEEKGRLSGTVVHIDHFGNIITNIPGHRIPMSPKISIGAVVIEGLAASYADGGDEQPLAIVGSRGTLEIAINGVPAAKTMGIGPGDSVHIEGSRP